MKPRSDTDTVILAVIRGEMPLDALVDIGIEVRCVGGSCELTSEAMPMLVTPSVFDIASGLLTHRASPEELRIWAFFVLAESGSIDLVKVESHAQGDLLINALWDASHEGKVPDTVIKVAEDLAKIRH